jgi:Transglycosylase SLT domain
MAFSQADLNAISAASQNYKVPLGILKGVATVETGGEPNPDTSVSNKGAVGLFQILPTTGSQPGYGVQPVSGSLTDPTVSANFAAQYLTGLYGKLGNWQDTLAAYNAGAGNLSAGQGYASKVLALAGSDVAPPGSSASIASGQTPVGQELTNAGGASATNAGNAQQQSTGIGWIDAIVGSVGAFVNEALLVGLGIGLILIALIWAFSESKTVQVTAGNLAKAAAA